MMAMLLILIIECIGAFINKIAGIQNGKASL